MTVKDIIQKVYNINLKSLKIANNEDQSYKNGNKEKGDYYEVIRNNRVGLDSDWINKVLDTTNNKQIDRLSKLDDDINNTNNKKHCLADFKKALGVAPNALRVEQATFAPNSLKKTMKSSQAMKNLLGLTVSDLDDENNMMIF